MKIKTRLYGAFLIVSFLVAFVGVENLIMNARRDDLADRLETIMHIRLDLTKAAAAHNKWVKNVYAFFNSDAKNLQVQVDSTKCQFGKFLVSDKMQEINKDFPTIVRILEDVKDPHSRIHNGATKINNIWSPDDEQARKAAFAILETDINPALEEVTSVLGKAQKEAHKIDNQVEALMIANREFSGKVTWGAIFLAFFCTAFLGWKISNGISVPLKKASDMAEQIGKGDIPSERLNIQLKDEIGQMAQAMDKMTDALDKKSKIAENVAEGDLTVEVELASNCDILGISLRTMVESLSQFLFQVSEAAIQVETSSSQISDASQALSQGATESSASLEEITSSMSDISGQTKTNADNAGHANQLATQTRSAAESGNRKMADMMKAMEEIQEASKGIAKIIKVIDDIAFQTNLLALNAAVEAARAGRHGKGFAVVAEEVRNLAGRSSKAASETADMIAQSISKVETGMEFAKITEKSLAEIKESSVKVADLVGEIAAASSEQAIKIEQIGQGLSQIDTVTQQNSASSEETAAAAADLLFQAKELSGLMRQFKLNNDRTHQLNNKPFKAQSRTKPVNSSAGNTRSSKPEVNSSQHNNKEKPADIIALDDDEFGRY